MQLNVWSNTELLSWSKQVIVSPFVVYTDGHVNKKELRRQGQSAFVVDKYQHLQY